MDDQNNPALTLLLSGIQQGIRDVQASVDGIRGDLAHKADASDVRDLSARVAGLESANEASNAVDDALKAVSNSRRAIVIATTMTALGFVFNVCYWTIIK